MFLGWKATTQVDFCWFLAVFCRFHIYSNRRQAFGHSLWVRVHQCGLFFCNTAGAWYLRGHYKPTWKPCRIVGLIHPSILVCFSQRQLGERWALYIKNLYYCNVLHVSVGVHLPEWDRCCGAGAQSERAELELDLRCPEAFNRGEHVDVSGDTWWCLPSKES